MRSWRRRRGLKPILAVIQASIIVQWAVFTTLAIGEGALLLTLIGLLGLVFGAAVLIAILLTE